MGSMLKYPGIPKAHLYAPLVDAVAESTGSAEESAGEAPSSTARYANSSAGDSCGLLCRHGSGDDLPGFESESPQLAEGDQAADGQGR